MVSDERVHHGCRLRVDVGIGIVTENGLLGAKNCLESSKIRHEVGTYLLFVDPKASLGDR